MTFENNLLKNKSTYYSSGGLLHFGFQVFFFVLYTPPAELVVLVEARLIRSSSPPGPLIGAVLITDGWTGSPLS
jgi:hypothetical protein